MFAIGAAMQLGASPAAGQTDLEAQALAIEPKLLGPQCTNLRLDIREIQIGLDMRAPCANG